MNRLRNVAIISIALMAAACGDNEVDKLPEAPARRPMELAPNPPMSASDIDAIVKEQGGSAAPPPATNGNTSGEQRK